MLRIVPFMIFVLCAAMAHAQCYINVSTAKVCLGATTTFSSGNSATDSVWKWSFGDGGNSNQSSPSYQYRSAGSYSVTLRKYFKGGTFCDAGPVNIIVVARPVAGFSNLTPYKQCFETNAFAFNDWSKPGLSGAPVIQRTMIYDDGAFVVQQAPFTDSLRHSYLHPAGNTYKIVLEVKDTNGCADQHIDSVLVYPQMNSIGLTAAFTHECYYTDVVFTHNGFYKETNTDAITWFPGNGDTIHAPPFNSLPYRYYQSQSFSPSIQVKDKNGCKKTDSLQFLISRNVHDTAILINQPTQCILDNKFEFRNLSTSRTSLKWILSGNNLYREVYNESMMQVSFTECGTYNLRMELEEGKCRFVKDTQVFVIGHTVTARPSPAYQCTTQDTVRFTSSYVACDTVNNAMRFLWNFKDNAAPPCTTSTSAGLNVGMNCNFSTDEKNVSHYYGPGSDTCFVPYLVLTDSVSTCVASAQMTIAISPIDVGWDSSLATPRRGVYYLYDLVQDSCSDKITFQFDELKPSCGPEKVFFLRDSMCIPHNWEDVTVATKNGLVDYTQRCTPGLVITYGVVGVTGQCYDTAWYKVKLPDNKNIRLGHRVVRQSTCKPFDVAFEITDSVNYSIEEIICNFGDNTLNYRKTYAVPDSIMQSFAHQYKEPGEYVYSVQYKFRTGCYAYLTDTIMLGKHNTVTSMKTQVCFPDSVSFEADPRYYSRDSTDFWGDPGRALAGKEALYWNFGDGTGWISSGKKMTHLYQQAGKYQVSVIIKDSTAAGCYDTIAATDLEVQVSKLLTRVAMLNDTFFCAPTIINYIDSSYVLQNDSTRNDTSLISRVWNFGAGKPESYLQNPGVYYEQNGIYKTRLRVSTSQGCRSDSVFEIAIIGPQPRFVIDGDTSGCTPFTVKLKNETGKQLAGWIWYFNDPTSQILSTASDTQVTFTYSTPGTYRIDLVGEDRIFNTTTGTYSNCSERFPYLEDPSDFHPRQVVVLKTDTLLISAADSICLNEVLTLSASGTSQVAQVNWQLDDGTAETSLLTETIAHSFDSSRVYKIVVSPVILSRDQCVTGAEKYVHVQFPQAGFDYDDTAYPEFKFINRSAGAVNYLWDFGQPSSKQNTSHETDPTHRYVNENKNVVVCLSVFDELGCMDSVCKLILLRPFLDIPNVFTPGNGDQANDAFDIEIEGWEKYEAYIYNRWGTLVFEGHTDGYLNDGINWNGKNKNDGSDCPEGVYYLVFRYKLLNQPAEKVYHGTITLIRKGE